MCFGQCIFKIIVFIIKFADRACEILSKKYSVLCGRPCLRFTLLLITDSFRINSGNNATKRRHDEAISKNYKFKMSPHPLNFEKTDRPSTPKLSPLGTPRRVLGELQNNQSPLAKILKHSPQIEQTNPSLSLQNSPLTTKRSNLTKISKIYEERTKFKMSNKENSSRSFIEHESFMKIDADETLNAASVFGDDSLDSPVSRVTKRSRINSSWTASKMTVTPSKVIEDSRDSGYSNSNQKMSNFYGEQTVDFSDIIASTSFASFAEQETEPAEMETATHVPENVLETDAEFETLHDLEQEFESDNFDECTKYEIISTDSPDIISRGRSTTKISSKNFVFGAPIGETEQSTSFNKPNITATRMLTFEDESPKFTCPNKRPRTSGLNVRKSLKFLKYDESPCKLSLSQDESSSSIGSYKSCTPLKRNIFPSASATSMESGFVSELDEQSLDTEDSNASPKTTNFKNLLSGQIKTNLIGENLRPSFYRSISCNTENVRAKASLASIFESPCEKRSLDSEEVEEEGESKRRRNDCVVENKIVRPVLHRAFSESSASIMSALARSASNPDLIGDFSQPFALPLICGQHEDLKSISSDILAKLLQGEYSDTISDFQIIDCRYPYEYEGGHIVGSRNLYTPEHVLSLMDRPRSQDGNGRSILVFHCEFSIERGPKLSRFLRSMDRSQHKMEYPNLRYPELYLLHEGYSRFFAAHPSLCSPSGYIRMLDPSQKHLLRAFRDKGQPLNKAPSDVGRPRPLNRHKSRSRLLL